MAISMDVAVVGIWPGYSFLEEKKKLVFKQFGLRYDQGEASLAPGRVQAHVRAREAGRKFLFH